jgi:hypothetical protein
MVEMEMEMRPAFPDWDLISEHVTARRDFAYASGGDNDERVYTCTPLEHIITLSPD